MEHRQSVRASRFRDAIGVVRRNMQPSFVPKISGSGEKYSGSAWRARFLRAPKFALKLAERSDFVSLTELASVKLGLKTGADDFFFLERLQGEEETGRLLVQRGVVVLRGQDGWRGQVALADLRPAILNPHKLFVADARCMTIPKAARFFYLYPRPGRLRYGLPEYIRLSELHGTHQGKLVRSNGSEEGWYAQVRSLVTSRWVLPYNSAYDYGAWSNPEGHVLNGRFVGADAHEEALSGLLGAVLNSTFAATGRLIEGVATGVEGAFDVGPPAARKIMVPDIRRFDAQGRASVEAVLREILDADVMPATPRRDASVPPLRNKLDMALLVALGLSSGKAAAVLDELYTSYARWRTTVEGVETQMRANRRQMSASGVKRDQNPIDIAGRRVWEEIKHRVPLFPKAYLHADETLEVVNVPASAAIPATKPLFDVGIVSTKTKTIDLGSFERVRYVAMLRTLGLVGNIEVPLSATKASAIVDLFEREQIGFLSIAEASAMKYVSGRDAIRSVVEKARAHWHSDCRKSALQTIPKPKTKVARRLS